MSETINNLNAVSSAIGFYSSAILTSIGIVGCTISSTIFFFNKPLNKTSMGYLYGWLSLFSLSSLLTDYFLTFLNSVIDNLNLMSTSANLCRLMYYFIRICPHLASWFNLYYTLVSRTITLTQNQTTAANETILVNRTITSGSCTIPSAASFAADIVSAAMRTWLPFVFIILFNLLAIRALNESGKRAQTAHTSDARTRREKEFAQVVLKLSLIFFLMNFPLSASWVISNCYKAIAQPQSQFTLACLNLFSRCSLVSAYAYQSLTIYLNFTFNSIFKREIIKLVCRGSRNDGTTTTAAAGQHSVMHH